MGEPSGFLSRVDSETSLHRERISEKTLSSLQTCSAWRNALFRQAEPPDFSGGFVLERGLSFVLSGIQFHSFAINSSSLSASMGGTPCRGKGDSHGLVLFQAEVVEGQPFQLFQIGEALRHIPDAAHVLHSIVEAGDHHMAHPEGNVPLRGEGGKAQDSRKAAPAVPPVFFFRGKFQIQQG